MCIHDIAFEVLIRCLKERAKNVRLWVKFPRDQWLSAWGFSRKTVDCPLKVVTEGLVLRVFCRPEAGVDTEVAMCFPEKHADKIP
ncbi:hypothetical protein DPMN_086981 [Dreissena polymorpha]|uniref:Uncharacterized protein n=1 Tax=Dreissena polymorpha TaxID=45954 RepID=A0A9D4KS55_DREPO|nr:hypothetical protein DPMN_086981 [Dreissena polymorpha]